jgi:DNA polymerase-3 subunit delta
MLIFLYGEDDFRSRQKLNEIKNKYLNSDKSGSGLSLFDFGEKADTDNMISTFSTGNLLAPKRLAIVKRIIAKALANDQKKILEFLKENKNISDDPDLVIVFWEEESPKKNNVLFKLLLSKDDIKKQEFSFLEGMKLSQWVLKRMKEVDEKASISKTALEKLIAYVGSDVNILDKEIDKLISFSDGQMITDRDVELLVRAKIDGNIFSAIDALGANNKKEAIKLLHDNLEKGDDPFYIFSMIIYQFRNMLKISDLGERGIASEYEISRVTKMHPFVIRKTLAQSRRFTYEKLKNTYNELADLDLRVKTGKIDMKLAIFKFVAEL